MGRNKEQGQKQYVKQMENKKYRLYMIQRGDFSSRFLGTEKTALRLEALGYTVTREARS